MSERGLEDEAEEEKEREKSREGEDGSAPTGEAQQKQQQRRHRHMRQHSAMSSLLRQVGPVGKKRKLGRKLDKSGAKHLLRRVLKGSKFQNWS